MIYFKSGKVTRVLDGDTIVVDGDKIRLVGIDTPEIHKGRNSEKKFVTLHGEFITDINYLWEWAKEAHKFLAKKVFRKKVDLYFDELLGEKGRYGRWLCYVYRGKTDINRLMVKKGLARVYPDNFEKLVEYGHYCYIAQKRRRGIWSNQLPKRGES